MLDNVSIQRNELTSALQDSIEHNSVLMIGPGAFVNTESNLSLRQEFVEFVIDRLKQVWAIPKIEASLCPEMSNIYDATICLSKGLDDEVELRRELSLFWQSRDIDNYPQILSYLRMPFKAILYSGYDDLLFKASQILGKKTKSIICSKGASSIVAKYADSPGKGAYSFTTNQAMRWFSERFEGTYTPIIQWFGNTAYPILSDEMLLDTVLQIIDDLKDSRSENRRIKEPLLDLDIENEEQHERQAESNASIALILRILKGNENDLGLFIAGADVSAWYNKLISISLSRYKLTRSPSYIDEQESFYEYNDTKAYFRFIGKTIKNRNLEAHTATIIESSFGEISKHIGIELEQIAVAQIFISYSSDDKSLAKQISKECINMGMSTYMYDDDKKDLDSHWTEKVLPQIVNAHYFVCILTSNYEEGALDSDGALVSELAAALTTKINKGEGFKPLILDFREDGQRKNKKFQLPQLSKVKKLTHTKVQRDDSVEIRKVLNINLSQIQKS